MIHKNVHIIYITHVLTHIIYIAHIIYITHISYITHIRLVKLIFKAHKKTDKTFFKIFFLYIKILTEYYKKNKEMISKKVREMYQNLSEEEKSNSWQYAREQYRNLSEEEKENKAQYGRKRYKNLLEDEKQRLVEYINFFEFLLSASSYFQK